MDLEEAVRRYAAMLDEAGLPRFDSPFHNAKIRQLAFIWTHGLTIFFDLTREMRPIYDWERASILGLPFGCECTSRST